MTKLPLVFVSYAHADRNRVRLLVQRFNKRKWSVWWDRATRIGEQWRNVIDDRLRHAACVVVVWTRSSLKSTFVAEEAQEGADRGVLVPLRLDPVRPPLGFRSYQYADLKGWQGGAHAELNRLVKDIANVLAKGVPTASGSSLDSDTNYARQGVREAKFVVKQVRAQSAMYKNNPEAASAVNAALGAISKTYIVVTTSIEEFLKPIAKGTAIGIKRYRPFATGSLVAAIQEKRGRCTELAENYIADGGLKTKLPENIPKEVVEQLDQLFLQLSEADMDLFNAMASIGEAMANESAVLVNLLAGKQTKAARERLQKADRLLAPLIRDLNTGKAALNRVAGELGLKVKGN